MDGEIVDEGLEVIGAGDEVRLAVHFHEHADLRPAAAMDVAVDRSLVRLLARALGGLGLAARAQELDRRLDISARFA